MLITICPHCQTQFYVNKEQLALAEGQVRCGRCQTIFDAKNNEAIPEKTKAAQQSDSYSLFEEQNLNTETEASIPPLPEISLTNAARGGYQFNVPNYLGSKIKLSNTDSPTPDTAENDIGKTDENEPEEEFSFLDFPQYYSDTENSEETPLEAEDQAIKFMMEDEEASQKSTSSFFTKGKPSIWTVVSMIALLILPILVFSSAYFSGSQATAPDSIALVSSKLNTSNNQAQLHLKFKITQATTIKNLPKMQITFQDANNQALSRIYLKPEQYLSAVNTVPERGPIETLLNFKLKEAMAVKDAQISWIH